MRARANSPVAAMAPKKPLSMYDEDPAERKFWQGVRANPRRTARDVRSRFRDIDRRLAEVEGLTVAVNDHAAETAVGGVGQVGVGLDEGLGIAAGFFHGVAMVGIDEVERDEVAEEHGPVLAEPRDERPAERCRPGVVLGERSGQPEHELVLAHAQGLALRGLARGMAQDLLEERLRAKYTRPKCC